MVVNTFSSGKDCECVVLSFIGFSWGIRWGSTDGSEQLVMWRQENDTKEKRSSAGWPIAETWCSSGYISCLCVYMYHQCVHLCIICGRGSSCADGGGIEPQSCQQDLSSARASPLGRYCGIRRPHYLPFSMFVKIRIAVCSYGIPRRKWECTFLHLIMYSFLRLVNSNVTKTWDKFHGGVSHTKQIMSNVTIQHNIKFLTVQLFKQKYFVSDYILVFAFSHQWHLISCSWWHSSISTTNPKKQYMKCTAYVPGLIWIRELESFVTTRYVYSCFFK